jgi:dienelactone hydrolase
MPGWARAFCILIFATLASAATAEMPLDDSRWSVTTNIPLESTWRSTTRAETKTSQVTADLFRPNLPGKRPAAVIINSSGGVTAHTELYYARVLASHGVAALVVDSFLPRGVRNTVLDQTLVFPSVHFSDAGAAFRWLAKQDFVDPARIMVIGMSRGGNAALATAVEDDRKRLGIEDIRFAAHVAVAPSCGWQQRNAASTGAPIFFVLSELDDYTPIGPCLEYAARLRASGNAKVRLAVYPGVYHAQESTGGIAIIQAERGRRCSYFRDSQWRDTDRVTGRTIPSGQERAHLLRTCLDNGPVTIGGDQRTKDQMVADILQFLREVGIIEDAAARTTVPDCGSFTSDRLKQNCARARAGWTGDMVALGRAYRYGATDGPPRDGATAARLFSLASERGHVQADWELALILQTNDRGLPQDIPRARRLLENAALHGEAAAMNSLGVLARDGVGQEKSDTEAAAWFRRAAVLRNSFGLSNLGRFHWQGRGGVKQDDAEAVRLWRMAAAAENPWALLYLGEALETGRGVAASSTLAIEHFRRAAVQQQEPQAATLAARALLRLGAK